MISLALKDKKYGVLGLGAQGKAVVQCLRAHDCKVIAWDDGDRTALPSSWEVREIDNEDMRQLDGLVVSAGISCEGADMHPVVRRARAMGCPILRDVSFFNRMRSKAKKIGVTGTDGKSSVVAMIAHGLACAGRQHAIGGNNDVPALSMEDLPEDGFYVVEVSSYQLESDVIPRMDCALLLNIAEDHLARHASMENYARIKGRLFEQCDHAIINTQDEWSESIARRSEKRGAKITRFDEQSCEDLSIAPSTIHRLNFCASHHALRWAGVAEDVIRRSFLTFKGLPHRCEKVGYGEGRLFVNDSKATNPHAAAFSLNLFKRIFWICGGAHKGSSFDVLAPLMPHVVKAYVVGEHQEPLTQWLDKVSVSYGIYSSQYDAMKNAVKDSEKGDVILLAPAAASFDKWRNFEERGNDFRNHAQKEWGAS